MTNKQQFLKERPDNGYQYDHDGINYNPKEFPLEIFPTNIMYLIEKLEETIGFQQQTTAAGILFAASSAIGANNYMEVKRGWDASASLWLAIVGNTGSMKSHPVNFCMTPLRKLEAEYSDEYKEEIKRFNASDKNGEEPRRKHRYTSNATTEGLVVASQYNPTGIGVHKDELRGLFQSFNQYKGGSGDDKEFYLQAFDNGTYVVVRVKGEDRYVSNMYYPIIGGIQPKILRSAAVGNIDNGMVQRFLYVENLYEVQPFTMDSISASEYKTYSDFINELYYNSLDEGDKYTRMNADALDAFTVGMNRLRDKRHAEGVTDIMKSYISKMETYYPRFVHIITLMAGEEVITPTSVYKADNLARYFISSAESVFSGVNNQITVESIFKANRAISPKEKVQALLNEFSEMSDTKIGEHAGCTRGYVNKVRNGKK